jgi:hypothetical protein
VTGRRRDGGHDHATALADLDPALELQAADALQHVLTVLLWQPDVEADQIVRGRILQGFGHRIDGLVAIDGDIAFAIARQKALQNAARDELVFHYQ